MKLKELKRKIKTEDGKQLDILLILIKLKKGFVFDGNSPTSVNLQRKLLTYHLCEPSD